MNLNKAFVLGNLTRDPERKQLPSGQAVVNFGVATNRYFTTREGEKREEAEFHNIVIFGKLAETAHQYLKKGSLVLIEGRIKTRNWDDPASGLKRYKTEIIAERMQLGPRTVNIGTAGSKFQPASQTPSSTAPSSPNPQIKTAVSDEEIPVIQEDGPAPKSNPFNKENEEIDVKSIPF